MSTGRFFPREDLVERLKSETRQVVGFDIYDVRWDNTRIKNGREVVGRDCLCIYELNRKGHEMIRKELRAHPTDPTACEDYSYLDPNGIEVCVQVPLQPGHPDYEKKVLGAPRQINEGDVFEAVDAARNALKRSKQVLDKLTKQKEERDRERDRVREDYISETAREMVKAFAALRSGKNAFVDLGSNSSKQEDPGPLVITDRRRVV